MAGDRRRELYERIRNASRDEVILEEMQRLGFWPSDEDMPDPGEALIRRKGELERELRELLRDGARYADPEQALAEMRKARMAAAKARRIETRERRRQARCDKALAWHQRRGREILYLGEDVSKGLAHAGGDSERLARHDLPALATAADLAEAMGIALAELRFLCFNRPISRVSHYRRFTIPKKTGGERLISAPMPRLKRAQYWVLERILAPVPVHEAAHGFRPGRSIVSNAEVHVGAHLVLNCDLKDFFPTLDYPRIKGLFLALGYGNQLATLLALICTEPEVDEVELDGERYFVARGARVLPQGAPTSPAITNLICRRLDRRLAGAANKLGFRCTRYADDLSFSGDRTAAKALGKLRWGIGRIVEEEGFRLHPDKTRAMRADSRQEVTGVVVNRKPSLARPTLRRFRALLHRMERDGVEAGRWNHSSDALRSALGFANYVHMVDPAKGARFRAQLQRIVKREGWRAESRALTELSPRRFRAAAAEGRAPREAWWTPQEPPEPVMPEPETRPSSPEPSGIERIATAELIEQAVSQPRGRLRMPRHGRSRRLIGWGMGLLRGLAVAFVALALFRASPLLGILFLVAYYYFRRSLRQQR